jgi:hypothetical protein
MRLEGKMTVLELEMKEMTMLDLEKVDLGSLCEALEDHSYESSWWLDPETGEIEFRSDSFVDEEEDEDPESRGLISIDPVPSHESYGDMEDFAERIRDARARDLLVRAIAGRGAFRRFKDTLFDFPELRQAWFRFHDARIERRALQWLAAEGVVDPAAAERAVIERGDPDLPELSGPFDPAEIAESVAEDLRRLYKARFRRVLLFGSWARGDASPESDIDLLVVLDRVESPWDELRRGDDILWRHSFENDATISAVPVGEKELDEPTSPVLIRARAEGRVSA